MLIPIAVFAVFVMVGQASAPVPRETPDSATSTGEHRKQAEYENKGVAQSVSAFDKPEATADGRNGGEENHPDTEHPVTISKLPAMTINTNRDWADWGLWVFNLLLVAVGAGQVYLLFRTLKAIETQAGHMEVQTGILTDSVKAAKDSAQAAVDNIELVISKERARLNFVMRPFRFQLFNAPPGGRTLMLVVDFSVIHLGTTPAFVSIAEAVVMTAYSNDAVGPPSLSDLPIPSVIAPSTQAFNHQTSAPVSEEDHTGINNGTITVHFFGLLLYKDVFGRSHTTGVYYVWRPQSKTGFTVEGWRKQSYPGYDQET